MLKQGYVKNVIFLLTFGENHTTEVDDIKLLQFAPVLSVARKDNCKIDRRMVLIPDWVNLNIWYKISPRIKIANNTFLWEQKIDKVFWRGGYADVSGYGLKIINLSKTTNYKPQFGTRLLHLIDGF